MKVLVFDKSLDVRLMIKKNISTLNGIDEVYCVESMQAVITELRDKYFDFIVIDLDNVNGSIQELFNTVERYQPAPKILMLTLFPDKNVISKIIKIGADYCFDKITEFEFFIKTIDNLINGGDEVEGTSEQLTMVG